LNIGSLSTYSSLASGLWIIALSTVWALLPGLAPAWYNYTASTALAIFALSYLVSTVGLWMGIRGAVPVTATLLAAGGLAWAIFSSSAPTLLDLTSISLLLGSALMVLAASRRRARRTFHPLDYPIYG
jgi:hypothetical protein